MGKLKKRTRRRADWDKPNPAGPNEAFLFAALSYSSSIHQPRWVTLSSTAHPGGMS